MAQRDAQENSITGASAAAVALFDQAVAQLQSYRNDPIATLDEAIADSPGFVMAYAMKAHIALLATETAMLPMAREAVDRATLLPANEREQGHLASVKEALAGDFVGARDRLETVLYAHPRDALALQAAHLWDFYLGDARNLRDHVSQVLPAWSPSIPGYGAVLGMYAFGLEETADYGRAEARGREAIALNPQDAWAQHAVAHVMEMQGRTEDGIAWMRGNEAGWSQDNFFAVHNWWHLALYHLDRGEHTAVLALFDGPIDAGRSTVVLDMVDAAALLWRLKLRDIELGDRWQPVADVWAERIGDGHYAFNDMHAMMALVGAGREDAAERLLETMVVRLGKGGTNDLMLQQVGLPVARAIHAFGAGDYRRTVALLRPVRSFAARFGGSHAQRDVIDWTLTEAAVRAGDAGLAQALAAERLALKPDSPVNRLFRRRAEALTGRLAA